MQAAEVATPRWGVSRWGTSKRETFQRNVSTSGTDPQHKADGAAFSFEAARASKWWRELRKTDQVAVGLVKEKPLRS